MEKVLITFILEKKNRNKEIKKIEITGSFQNSVINDAGIVMKLVVRDWTQFIVYNHCNYNIGYFLIKNNIVIL